ncbi:hypothetical protein BP6252_05899 [Coleophoma cylindrospora]|uniref:Uncharacterized protein n=1 Tax=Coleophoma cylindrospora TaxID=1849047 RepID=A0A3D8RL32_9HELO|nr:hypothetical protein BP6252_05899 [Coleophoma cylindrospora]
MGQYQSTSTEMNMLASPEIAQMIAKKLQRHRKWHKPQISTSFEDGKRPEDLQAGDQIRVNMKKAVFNLTVIEHSSELVKQHLCFTNSEKAKDGSLVAQKSNLKVSGMNTYLFGPGWNMSIQTRPKSEFTPESLKPVTEKETN